MFSPVSDVETGTVKTNHHYTESRQKKKGACVFSTTDLRFVNGILEEPFGSCKACSVLLQDHTKQRRNKQNIDTSQK